MADGGGGGGGAPRLSQSWATARHSSSRRSDEDSKAR